MRSILTALVLCAFGLSAAQAQPPYGDLPNLTEAATLSDYLRDQEENRLYHRQLLRVKAEQHFKTGELRNVRLIEFVRYRPRFDQEALDRIAAEGAKAWADVPDAAQWVRELRGA